MPESSRKKGKHEDREKLTRVEERYRNLAIPPF
jgi:hypothetical protein